MNEKGKKKNTLNTILNILLVISGLAVLVCLLDAGMSVSYRKEQDAKDDTEEDLGVFEYRLEKGAYGEVLSGYYADRLSDFEPKEGYEETYHVAEYAHAAFMARIYEAKEDTERLQQCTKKMDTLRKELGLYIYTSDKIDAVLESAP